MTGISVEEQRAGALVEHLPFVTYTVLLEPPFPALYVSPQLEQLFGISPLDCLADADFWLSRVADDDRPRLLEALAVLCESHAPMSVEYRLVTGDGREVWIRDCAVVSAVEGGAFHAHGYLTDVTREKELERDLAAERAQVDAFFRDSSVGLAITDAHGRYVRVNEALARTTGATPEDHVGRTLAEVAPGIAPVAAFVHEAVRETGLPVRQQELEIPAPGGGVQYVLLSMFPLELGGVRHYGRIVVDITEQRRAERERADAEQQYRRLIEQLPLVTYVNGLDPEPRATFVSPQIEELYGYPPQAFLDDPTLGDRVIHPDDVARIELESRKAREHGRRAELEYRIVRRDGGERWVLDLMETVCDDDGEALYEQGFIVDITERRESDLFRAVFDNAFEGVLIADDEGRYTDANPAACELFGRTRDELLGYSARDFALPGSVAPGALRQFLNAGGATGHYVIVRPDGEERDVEFAARANVLPGRHVSVLRDVTHRKQLERGLWRAQRLESVGRLAGGVAHDFNNMLTAIRGHAQLLEARTVEGSVERRHAEEIDRAADRAAALTAQLLAFARRQTLQTRPVDVNRLVERLEDMLVRVVGDGTDLVFDLDPTLHPARVDPSQIEQVLLNLVANAADATAAAGRILVRTYNAQVGCDDDVDLQPGRYAVVVVEDTGGGIEAAALEHLFEPFFTTKSVGDGTGLGLATAYGIVKQSGGTIAVATRRGEASGSTFSVYLPEAAVERGGAGGGGETILVVEADAAVRDVVFDLLSDAGYRVRTARSPAAAAELAARFDGEIDLLVSDLVGAEAGRLVDALAATRPALRTLSLQKPYTPARLRTAVRLALGVTRTGDPAP